VTHHNRFAAARRVGEFHALLLDEWYLVHHLYQSESSQVQGHQGQHHSPGYRERGDEDHAHKQQQVKDADLADAAGKEKEHGYFVEVELEKSPSEMQQDNDQVSHLVQHI